MTTDNIPGAIEAPLNPPKQAITPIAAQSKAPRAVAEAMKDFKVDEAATEEKEEAHYEPRYIDVGVNLTDDMYGGTYNGKLYHERDLEDVIGRAAAVGCQKLMVTGSSLKDSRRAVKMSNDYPGIIYATVGVHPCSSKILETHPEHLVAIKKLAIEGKESGHVTAFGEIGLDYDRLKYASKEVQIRQFDAQLRIAEQVGLPLFLHSRAAAEDFERMLLAANLPRKGLVHSFTGGIDEMRRLVAAGYDIGVNGCSLKTQENLDAVKEIPLERLQLETDGPWCEIRPSHASSAYLKKMPTWLSEQKVKDQRKDRWKKGLRVKGRNEPCAISEVAWVVAQVKEIEFEEVCEASWNNSMKMFGFGKVDEERLAKELLEHTEKGELSDYEDGALEASEAGPA